MASMSPIQGRFSSEIDVQRERIASLRREREHLEKELRARSANANELRLKMKQREREKARQIKEKMGGTHLGSNLHSTFGVTAVDKALDFYDPPTGHTTEFKQKSGLLAEVMEQRKMEHRAKTGQYQEAINLLNDHRRNILDEQNRLHEDKRKLIGGRYSPSVASIPGDHDPRRYPRPQYPVSTPHEPSRAPYYPFPDGGSIETMENLVERVKTLIPNMEKTVSELKKDLDLEDRLYVTFGDGEKGLGMFEPHQREAAVICRSIVNEIVEKSMDNHLRQQLPVKQRKLMEEEAFAVTRELNKYHKTTTMQRMCALLRDELVLEVTAEMSSDAIDEYFEICKLAAAKSNNLLIKAAEISAAADDEERLPDDPDYLKVNKVFEKYLRERKEKKYKLETMECLWRHSLPVTHISGKPVVEISEDVEPIDIQDIKPFELRENDLKSAVYMNFLRKEAEYWQDVHAEHTQIKLNPDFNGCQCAKLSSKHRLLAVGTVHGEVLVYDLFQTEPRLLYVARAPARKDYPIESMAWSADDSQLVCQRDNSLTLFNLQLSLDVDAQELEALGLTFKKSDTFKPFSLFEVTTLSQRTSDFVFKVGPVSENNADQTAHPLGVCKFHPVSTLSGSSFSVVASFENGDIQKLELEDEILNQQSDDEQKQRKVIYPPLEKKESPAENFIGKNVKSELFKGHKSALLLIAFLSGVGEMITLDEAAYLYWWRYSNEYFTEVMEPYRKMKLKLQKTVYLPVDNGKPAKVAFRRFDLDQKGREIPLSEEKLMERIDKMEMELFLKSIEDSDIVWQDLDPSGEFITRKYPADAISKSGSTFYTVTRRQRDKELWIVEKELLRPQNVKSSRILEAETTPDGDILIYMVLFDEIERRKPHISFFAYNLETKSNVDMRLDIQLTKREFDIALTNNVCSFETTRPFDTTSTAYIIVNVIGEIRGYSLTTGTPILTASQDPFVGLNLMDYPNLPRSIFRLSATANILVASPPKKDRIQVIVYSPDQNNIEILSLTDQNPPEDRKAMWLAYKTLALMQPGHILEYDPEQRVRKLNWNLDEEEYVSATTTCRSIALDIIDAAVDVAFFEKSSDLEPEPQFDQSGQQIVDENGAPVLIAPKRGYPEDYKLQQYIRMNENKQRAISSTDVLNAYGDLKLYPNLEEIDLAFKRAAKKYEKRNRGRKPANRVPHNGEAGDDEVTDSQTKPNEDDSKNEKEDNSVLPPPPPPE